MSGNGAAHEDIQRSIRRRLLGEIDLTTLVLVRQDIERKDPEPVLAQLRKLLDDKQNIRRYQGWLNLSVNGYDNDKRELFQISEVCKYFSLLASSFPYLFYFLSLDTPILHVIAFCVSDAQFHRRADRTVLVEVDQEKLAQFKLEQFAGLNRLFEAFDLDRRFPGLSRDISDRVDRYFREREAN